MIPQIHPWQGRGGDPESAGGRGGRECAMSQFLGTHQTRLDSKNRTSVPSAFRTALRNGDERAAAALILRPSHKHACIEAWPAEAFHAFANPLSAMEIFADDE